jgi:hypothetical protein
MLVPVVLAAAVSQNIASNVDMYFASGILYAYTIKAIIAASYFSNELGLLRSTLLP